jgi:hypothetical protein
METLFMSSILPIWVDLWKNQGEKVLKMGKNTQKREKTLIN